MNATRVYLLGCIALVLGAVASADELDTKRREKLQPLAAADGRSAGPTFLDAATIEAGTSDTKASIGITGYLPKSGEGNWYQHYGLKGEAAISKGSTEDAAVGTLSGLSKGSSAEAVFSWLRWPRMSTEVFETRVAFCRKAFRGLIGAHEWDDAALAGDGADSSCDVGLFTVERLDTIANAVEAQRKLCGEGKSKLKSEQCDRLAKLGEAKLVKDALLAARLARILSEWEALDLPVAPAQFFSIAAKANRAKANYFVETDLTKLTKDHTTGYGGTASYSYFHKSYLVSGGFSLEKSYKNNDEVEVCSPIADTTAVKCITGAIGAPKHSFSRIAFAEGRWLLAKGRIGIAPRAEYDFAGSNYAVRVPVYLAPDKKKALIGGIALGYTDKDDEGFGITVFVGKAFSFFD